jgi:hypothetical protein
MVDIAGVVSCRRKKAADKTLKAVRNVRKTER